MGAPIPPAPTAVVIVAADSGPLLRQCVASVLASASAVEIVLVDNASSDGEVERVLEDHVGDTRLRVLRNPSNVGFGTACNRGAATCDGDIVVFLNPDCVIGPDVLSALRSVLDTRGDIGLVGCEVCQPDGRPARGNRRRDPTLMRALSTLTGLARWEARWPRWAGVEMPLPAVSSDPELIEAVSGACMAMPRKLFVGLGGFDEGYFLHAEDLDLCRRVRDAGLAVAVAHSIRLVHAQGSSSRHRPLFVARHKHDGMWRYFNKFDPAAKNPALRVLVRIGIRLHLMLTAFRIQLQQHPPRQ